MYASTSAAAWLFLDMILFLKQMMSNTYLSLCPLQLPTPTPKYQVRTTKVRGADQS